MAKYLVKYVAAGKLFFDSVEADGIRWDAANIEGVAFFNNVEDAKLADDDKTTEATIAFYPPQLCPMWQELQIVEQKQEPGDFLAWLADGKHVRRSSWTHSHYITSPDENTPTDCFKCSNGYPIRVPVPDLLATDWLIVEDTDTENVSA